MPVLRDEIGRSYLSIMRSETMHRLLERTQMPRWIKIIKKLKRLFSTFSLDHFMREYVGVKRLANETMDDVEERLEIMIARSTKALIRAMIMLTGLVFLLVGAAFFIESKTGLDKGAGHLIVGGVLLVLVMMARLMSD